MTQTLLVFFLKIASPTSPLLWITVEKSIAHESAKAKFQEIVGSTVAAENRAPRPERDKASQNPVKLYEGAN